MLNARNINSPLFCYLLFHLIIRHQQNRFKHVERTLSKEIKDCRMELFHSLLYKKRENENRSSCPEVFCKKVFLEISQNSQENICPRASFLIKLQAWPATLLKKRLWHRCFAVKFVKLLRMPFFTEHLWWLLL